jgi:hypothetical protein
LPGALADEANLAALAATYDVNDGGVRDIWETTVITGTVAGAGPISFPVKAAQAKRMVASARPARFGRGEQTLMDLSVRGTWEITPDQVVTLTGLDWGVILAEVRDGLGLPARARLRAEPHALLVYGKGQF